VANAPTIGGQSFDEAIDSRRMALTVLDRPDTSAHRIKEHESLSARLSVIGAHQFFDLRVSADVELYFEEGELAMPPTFDETPEEQLAGF
jgi:hypothetical protein